MSEGHLRSFTGFKIIHVQGDIRGFDGKRAFALSLEALADFAMNHVNCHTNKIDNKRDEDINDKA